MAFELFYLPGSIAATSRGPAPERTEASVIPTFMPGTTGAKMA
jgi:hypothetical protein